MEIGSHASNLRTSATSMSNGSSVDSSTTLLILLLVTYMGSTTVFLRGSKVFGNKNKNKLRLDFWLGVWFWSWKLLCPGTVIPFVVSELESLLLKSHYRCVQEEVNTYDIFHFLTAIMYLDLDPKINILFCLCYCVGLDFGWIV